MLNPVIFSDSARMNSTSANTAANGFIASSAVPPRQKRSLNTSNAEAGPSNSKRPRTTSTFDGLYDSDGVSNEHAKPEESRGYLVVDIVERAHDVPEAEWYRRVEVRARSEVFKLQLTGKAQSGPAVIQCVLWQN